MPNLNLKNDAPDEPSEMSEISEVSESVEAELLGTGSGGSIKKVLPVAAGAVIAVMLALFILNTTGVVHLWGKKKASSEMTVSVPVDSASQAISDAAMAEQFKKDSLEAVAKTKAGVRGASKRHAAATQAVKTAAPAQKAAAIEPKKPAVAAAAQKPAEKTPAAPAVAAAAPVKEKNISSVEVPGAAQKHRAAQAEPVEKKQTPPVAAAAKKSSAGMTVEKKAASASAPAPKPRRSAVKAQEAAAPAAAPAAAQAAVEKPKAAEGNGKFTVQISSWTSQAKAKAFSNRFTQAGIPTFVYTQGHIHRVCTGHFATQDEATARAEALVPLLESKYDIITLK